MTAIQLTFEETVEFLMSRHKVDVGGTAVWVDWDAIYSDLLDEGFNSREASELLDKYIEDNGF